MILILRPISKKLGIIDTPSQRKTHEGNIPLIGGLCIFAGVIIATLPYILDNHILLAILIGGFFSFY